MKKQNGQTLLEVLLAFSVLILVLSAIIIGVTTSLSNTQYTKNQNLANSYAKQGMAVVRQLRDSSWPNFSSKDKVNYCLAQENPMKLVELTSTDCGQNVGIFSREVTIERNLPDCSAGSPPTPTPTPVPTARKVTVTVSWSDSKCPVGNPRCHNVKLISCFSNIDIKPTP